MNNFRLYGAMILLIQALFGCGPGPKEKTAPREPAAASAVAGKDGLVIAFGDSLYAGYKLSPKQGFAPQLAAALQKDGYAVSVLNAGVSGDTTAAGRARLGFVLDNAPVAPKLVLLGLGGNDMLRGIKPAEAKANLSAMLSELQRRKIKVVLTGMLASPNMGAAYAKQFNAIYPDLAKQYDIALYPFFLDGVVTDGRLMMSDGTHPNEKGIAKIVEGIKPIAEKALSIQAK
jgi:acyl-CoA thioesterase I